MQVRRRHPPQHTTTGTLNHTYPAKDATFDFPISFSLADRLRVVELLEWDKDILKKDYFAEVAAPLNDWFNGQEFGFGHPRNTVRTLRMSLYSRY